ncbi:hypothetical protein IWQ56_006678 [Coemansia nantahalensis]|uniref:Uncharacterized protein n=2 Tax=Coemansia TaxID=4863 RepID=A0ACC1KDX0_9FUNG|nr:hypothetical protein IWQ56_006678 [Coemansia nantahalensis]KAJ2759230.1 hypothetical protein IWQ57_006609 [Coemansia nantahalensis]KAJ2787850.1 hypothetical protein H4R21_007074 [Coemansia helicoidea]
MTVSETLRVLDTLSKRRLSKRERALRARQNLDAFVRGPAGSPQPEKPLRQEKQRPGKQRPAKQRPAKGAAGKVEKVTPQMLRDRNAATLRAADRLVTARCQDLHRDVLELLRARKERRQPKLKRKQQRSYFDFEDA